MIMEKIFAERVDFGLQLIREGIKKQIDFFLGKSPKLWVGGGQES